MRPIVKYPRTHHVEGSRLQPGDEDLHSVPLAELSGCPLVVEEKLDGANAAFSFDEEGRIHLQSRGHYLTGGARERHFGLFKTWAACHQRTLFEVVGPHRVVYGEWLYAKHTVFYDRLPHYFMEFDVLDTRNGEFLSTDRRHQLLRDLPLVSVPVVHRGPVASAGELAAMVRPSLYKSETWRESLAGAARAAGVDPARAARETDGEDLSEGLYIKHEEEGRVVGRYKFVRASFLTAVLESESHWLDRPIVPNGLAEGVDLYGELP